MRRHRRSRATSGPRFSAHQATHTLGLHLLLALVLLTAMMVFTGCRVADDTDDGSAASDPADSRATTGYQPSEAVTPLSGYDDDIAPERIDAERYDSSWRDYATRDREDRTSALTPRPGEAGRGASTTAPTESATSAKVTEKNTGADRSRALASGADEDGTVETSIPTPGAVGRDEGPNPVLSRLRREPAGAVPHGTNGTNGTNGADVPQKKPTASSASPESWDDIAPGAFGGEPRFPIDTKGGGPTVLRIQWLLDSAHFSPGVIDGRWGKNTEKAVYWLQDSLGMDPTGVVDRPLYDRLQAAVGESSPVREHRLTAADLEGPFVEIPDEPEGKAELDCLCYASVEEKLAEMFHVTPELLGKLNPDVDLGSLSAGDSIQVPAVEVMKPGEPGEGGTEEKIAKIVISKRGFYLQALDANGDVLYHFPSTLGGEYDPSPEGDWKVTGVGWKPDFHYQPKLFSEVPDNEDDLLLPPGPNSPVGLVWIALSKENYGIHGTAEPATIGYTSSHGCIRLTNWDAVFLGHRVKPGTPVMFRE